MGAERALSRGLEILGPSPMLPPNSHVTLGKILVLTGFQFSHL